MVRFLHTADWQMGLKASQMGLKAREVREKRFETIARIAKLARDERVDFVVIAGDTFDDNDIDEGVVKRTVDQLNGLAPVPVFVLPGNHDHLCPGSVWTRPGWRAAGPSVHLLERPEEVEVGDGVVLYPCPLSQKRTSQDPTGWIPPRRPGDARIRVGVAHGGMSILPRQVNFPIPVNRSELSGLDYLALGDWHGLRENGRACYPGTPEPTAFDEADPGNVLIVEIQSAGDTPKVLSRRVALLRWVVEEQTISDPTDVRALDERVKGLGAAPELVLRVRPKLDSALPKEIVEDLKVLRKAWSDSCFFLDWPEEGLGENPSDGGPLPDGLLFEADTALAARAASGGKSAIVAEARSLLRRFTQEART